MKATHFDESNWPVLEIKIRATHPTASELQEYFDTLEQYYARNEPFVTIYDASQVNYILSSEFRIKLGRFVKDHEPIIRKCVQAYIFVLPNVFGRIILKGVLLLAKLPVPYHVVNELSEAYQLAQEYTQSVAA